MSGITDFNGNLVLDFVNYKLDEKPNYTVAECKERDATYAAALRVTARLLKRKREKSRSPKSSWAISP